METSRIDSAGIEVSVLIVTYGAREATMRCLDSVKREIRQITSEVIIVDNGSPGGLAEEIVAGYPDFRVLPQVANLGFALAANLGADLARGNYLLFLNPDTLVLEGAIVRLLEFARRRPEAGIWGGRTLYADGSVNRNSCRRLPTLCSLFCTAFGLDTRFPNSKWFAAMGYGDWARDSERLVDVVCGSFLLIDRRLWDRLGGFAPLFFMYGEDDDFCWRARRLGFRPAITPDATIIHCGSGTELNQERKIAQILASRALLVRGHFPVLTRPAARILLRLRPLLGKRFGKRSLRALWGKIWTQRRQWLRGQFVA